MSGCLYNHQVTLTQEHHCCLRQMSIKGGLTWANAVPGEQRRVAQWRGNGEVAVQRDHAQGFYTCCHTQHICGCPEFAHEVPKPPDSQQDVARAKGNHNQTHDEVSNGKRSDEEVGDRLESLEP